MSIENDSGRDCGLNRRRMKGYLVKEGKMHKITPAGKEMLLDLKEICSILNIEEH
jgi:hypothetical protein